MNTKPYRNHLAHPPRGARGMTLLDILLAIVIFVFGMLALTALQGNLSRSSTDANARTVAASVAEELIEELRTFEQLESATGVDAFQDIVTHSGSETRAGVAFNYT
ncbi:MAG: hypothetical protein HKP16_03850, partial [Xanthomonadales bacterium]|nr:hypothetical protein [Xanthomonadales bacterium]